MTAAEAMDLAYAISWRSSGIRSGAHRSRLGGASGLHKDLVPLIDEPDPRRLDIRASFNDPFDRLLVKRAERPGAINVYVLVDVSRSMAFEGNVSKVPVAADIAIALAACARRAGDAFGLLAFDDSVREYLSLPKSRSLPAQTELIARLADFKPQRSGIGGAKPACARLPASRCLVFLISDFLWRQEDAQEIADLLSAHDVVPIILEDSAALEGLPDWGVLSLRDLESGGSRLIFMRPQLKQCWRDNAKAQRIAVLNALSRVARTPLTMTDRIDWQRLGAYLMHGAE